MKKPVMAVLLAVTVTLAGCTGGTDGDEDRGALAWKACAAPSAAQGGGGTPPSPLKDGTQWECATLDVPLDYAKPHGGSIGLALIRARAKDQAHRIGSLVFNFGGPGGSGVATLPQTAADYTKLHSRYDLVSFDPRGVGESAGVRCLDDKALDASYATDGTPDDTAEERAAVREQAALVAACRKHSAAVLPHVGTTEAARDLDRLREALGEEKLHYFGISYGTELGAVYAHLYPRRVGRAVLDGVVDPTQDPVAAALGQAKGFQLALDDYLEANEKGAVAAARERLTTLLAALDRTPLPTDDAAGRKLTQSAALNGVAAALYSEDTWRYLKLGLREAEVTGSGNMLLALSDALAERDQKGHYSSLGPANTAITCADARQRYTAADVHARLAAFRKASPVFGEALAWSLLQCTGWPVRGQWTTPGVSAKGAAPMLVIGNTGDPATPYAGARRMADRLGKGVGIGITYKGEGHGAYNSGNACMTRTVDAYLLDGRTPADGTTCS